MNRWYCTEPMNMWPVKTAHAKMRMGQNMRRGNNKKMTLDKRKPPVATARCEKNGSKPNQKAYNITNLSKWLRIYRKVAADK